MSQRQQNRRARAETRRRLEADSTHPVPLFEILQYLHRTDDAAEALQELERAALADPAWGETGVPPEHQHLWEEASCAVALVLLLHAARLCVALNVTVGEVHAMTAHQGRLVLRVASHKTATSGGRACLALRPRQARLVRRVADVRRYLPEGGLDTARLLVAGNASAGKPRHLFRPFLRTLGSRHPARGLVFNDMRREVESQRFLVGSPGRDDKATAESISTYLCHSGRVAKLHYARRSDAVVVAEARLVECTLSQLLALQLVRASPSSFLPGEPIGAACYPSGDKIQARLAGVWPAGGHVCLHPLSGPTQASVAAWWREQHRHLFVRRLAEQVVAAAPASAQPAEEHRLASRFVREADPVWSHDACELVAFILEEVAKKRRAGQIN